MVWRSYAGTKPNVLEVLIESDRAVTERVRCRVRLRPVKQIGLNMTTSDRQEYPLDLSILFSGGKETKRDSPSNGE